MKSVIKSLIELKQLEGLSSEDGIPYDFASLASNPDYACDSSVEPVILFLGTVSMKPTQYRSASAIMIFFRGHGILMDCAEGSYGQLYDHF